MKVQVIMSDADYRRIVAADGKRVKGSMGMINPQQFDFHAFTPAPDPPVDVPRLVKRTTYGRTEIKPDKVRFVVMVKRGKGNPQPSDVIYDEADTASQFIFTNI